MRSGLRATAILAIATGWVVIMPPSHPAHAAENAAVPVGVAWVPGQETLTSGRGPVGKASQASEALEAPPLPPGSGGAAETAQPRQDRVSDISHTPAPPTALTLDELERIALESNPTLLQARLAMQATRGNYLQAGLYPNPVIGYRADEAGNVGSAGFQGASVGQEIITSGKLRLGRAVASYEVEEARLAWEVQRRRVLNDVRARYYDVLVAQRLVEINEQLARIGEERLKAAQRLWAAREVSRTDVLQAQIEAETTRLNLSGARHALEGAWRRLAAVLGRPDIPPTPLAGPVDHPLPTFDWEETLARLWAHSPELARARVAVQRARCELARQYALRTPNLGVEAAVKNDTLTHYTVADIAIALPLPVFDRNQGRILRAEAELAAAQQEVRRVELALHERLASAFEQYATARRRVEVYAATILPNAKASLDLVAAGCREGEFSYLHLLTAQRTYFEANLNYLQSLRDFWLRCVEIEGLLLRGGLEPVERPAPSID